MHKVYSVNISGNKFHELASEFLNCNTGAYFNMSIHRAYVHILQPQLCMGKSMAVQVIHLNKIIRKNAIISSLI